MEDTVASSTTLIVLPGMDGTGELFPEFIELLKPHIAVKVVPYPRDRPMDYAELTDYVLQQVPQTGPIVLLGESFGGPLAIMVAGRLGERAAGLVLCCTFLRNPTPQWAALMKLAGLFPLNRLPAFMVKRVLLSGLDDNAMIKAIQDATASVRSRVLARRLQAVTGLDVAADLRRLTIPLLCIEGTNDNLVAPGTAVEVHTLQPDARTAFLDGPHCLLQVDPHTCAAEVVPFLSQLADD